MRVSALLASAVASVAIAQDGVAGRYCPNYLGATRALLEPYEGMGILTPPQGPPVGAITFANGQVITTMTADQGMQPNKPMLKLYECIFRVQVDFKTGSAEVHTGLPGTAHGQHRCWVLQKNGAVFTAAVYPATGNNNIMPCPSANNATSPIIGGMINNFVPIDNVPADFQPGCRQPRFSAGELAAAGAALTVLDGLVVAGNRVWLNNASMAMAGPVTGLLGDNGAIFGDQIMEQCLLGLGMPDLPTLTLPVYVSLPPGAPSTFMCYGARLNPVSGMATVGVPIVDQNGQPTNLDASGCPTFGATSPVAFYPVLSVAFKSLPPGAVTQALQGGLTAAGIVLAPTTNMAVQTRPVVNLLITIAGTLPASIVTNPASVINPCTLFVVRRELARNAGLNVTDMKLTLVHVIIGGAHFIFDIASDSPVNLIAAPCVPPSASPVPRVLREGSARELQTAGSLMMTGQAVTTPANQNTVRTNLNGANAAGLTAAFSTAVNIGNAQPSTSPATTGTAVVVAGPAPFDRGTVYKPNADIEQFHKIPRFTVVGGQTPSNRFELSETYVQGALAPAAGIIAFGVIFFLIYILGYFCAQCCKCFERCRPKRDPETYYVGCRKYCGAPRALVVFALLNAGLLLASIGETARFAQGIDKLFSASNDLTDIMVNTARLMKTGTSAAATVEFLDVDRTRRTVPSLYWSLTDVRTGATDLNVQMTSTAPNSPRANEGLQGAQYNPPSTVVDLVSALRDNLGSAITTADEVSRLLDDIAEPLKKTLQDIPIDQIRAQATVAGYIILAILAAIVFIWSSFVCQNSFAACIYKIASPLVIILVLLVSILAGAYYAIGVVGADICYNPSATILSQLPRGMSGMSELTYYMRCAEDASVPMTGALLQVQTAVDQIALASEQTINLNVQLQADRASTSPSDNLRTLYRPIDYLGRTTGGLATSMGNARRAVEAIKDTQISCSAIDPILQKLYTGMCNDGFGTVIALCRILIAASVMLIIHLGIGLDVCMYHPGDAGVWGKKEDAAEGAQPEGGFAGANPIKGQGPGAAAVPVKGHAPSMGAGKQAYPPGGAQV